MGEFLETRTVNYWSICFKWYVIPYPCRKKKEVEIWCYEFEWIRQAGKFLLWVTYEGCEDGLLYRWRRFQIGGGGGVIGNPPFQECFQGKKDDKGSCPVGDFDEVIE
jgi:hypothetical protein